MYPEENYYCYSSDAAALIFPADKTTTWSMLCSKIPIIFLWDRNTDLGLSALNYGNLFYEGFCSSWVGFNILEMNYFCPLKLNHYVFPIKLYTWRTVVLRKERRNSMVQWSAIPFKLFLYYRTHQLYFNFLIFIHIRILPILITNLNLFLLHSCAFLPSSLISL
jgi:hypothetical protein